MQASDDKPVIFLIQNSNLCVILVLGFQTKSSLSIQILKSNVQAERHCYKHTNLSNKRRKEATCPLLLLKQSLLEAVCKMKKRRKNLIITYDQNISPCLLRTCVPASLFLASVGHIYVHFHTKKKTHREYMHITQTKLIDSTKHRPFNPAIFSVSTSPF